MKIAGSVTLLAVIITGLIVASRRHSLPWKRALRWTLALSILPIIGNIAPYESMLFGYSTSVAWETFRIRMATSMLTQIGLQTGIIFLAILGLMATVPYVPSIFTRESRARFGRAADVAAM